MLDPALLSRTITAGPHTLDLTKDELPAVVSPQLMQAMRKRILDLIAFAEANSPSTLALEPTPKKRKADEKENAKEEKAAQKAAAATKKAHLTAITKQLQTDLKAKTGKSNLSGGKVYAQLSVSAAEFGTLFGSFPDYPGEKESKVVIRKLLNEEHIKTLFQGIKAAESFTANVFGSRGAFQPSQKIGTRKFEMNSIDIKYSRNTLIAKLSVSLEDKGFSEKESAADREMSHLDFIRGLGYRHGYEDFWDS